MKQRKIEVCAARSQQCAPTPQETVHRLTWRGYGNVSIMAVSKSDAIQKAIVCRDSRIPSGTPLYYGTAGSDPAVFIQP